MSQRTFETRVEVLKVHDELGLVLGWAVICKEKGEPYFDLQGHHIPEAAMFKSAADFMTNSRRAKEMHSRPEAGTVIFAFPLTEEVKKAFSIECDKTGLMIAMRPDQEMLAKFKSGELKGFSIGGRVCEGGLKTIDEQEEED